MMYGVIPRITDLTPLCKPSASFPRYNMTNYGRRAFSYTGLDHAWNLYFLKMCGSRHL